MSSTRLRTVLRSQGAVQALKDGSVDPDGVMLDFTEVPVLVQAFRRMVRTLEFDVCEMALTTYLCAKSVGIPFTALPVFVVRAFHHGAIQTSVSDGRPEPRQLEGRRVGVNRGYTVTTGVWARSILATEHGVDLNRVTWVRSGDEHVEQYQAPANVVQLPADTTLADQLAAGGLAATVGADIQQAGVVPLIPDPDAAAWAAFDQRGLYPINHLIVVKDAVLAAHPGVATALFEAFAEAKRGYLERLAADAITETSGADRLHRAVLDRGSDPLPYGVEPNRAVLEQLIRHAVDQRIISQPMDVDAVFAPETTALTS